MKKFLLFLILYLGFSAILSLIGILWLNSYTPDEIVPSFVTILGPTLSLYFVIKYSFLNFIIHYFIGSVLIVPLVYFVIRKRSIFTIICACLGLFCWLATGYITYSLTFYG